MKCRLRLATLIATLTATPVWAAAPHVLVVSVDGLSWSTMRSERKALPHLDRIASNGVHGSLRPVFPTMTWPMHATFATGALPAQHGVVGNRFVERTTAKLVETWQLPSQEALRVPAMWDLARAKNLKTAALLWPATSRAAIDWNLPEVYGQQEFEAAASPGMLSELARSGLPVEELRRLGHEELFLLDSFTRDAAVHLIRTKQPALLLVHLLSHDTAQHGYGPGSRPAAWTLDLVDRLLGDLLAAYGAKLGETDVLVVSDHGFQPTLRYVDPNAAVRACGVKGKVQTAVNGHALYLYLPPDALKDLPAIRQRCSQHKDVARALPVDATEVFGPAPQGPPDPRLPDLVLLAPREAFWSTARPRDNGPPTLRGMHGALASEPELQAAFAAMGPHVLADTKQQALEAVQVFDVVTSFLGVRPAGRQVELPTWVKKP
jgi:hypothetical protein